MYSELSFLNNYWLKNNFSLESWVGPRDATNDFIDKIKGKVVEVKHSSINNIVKISSIHQLNTSRGMILAVFELSEDDSGENLDELVEKIINENSIDEFVFEDLAFCWLHEREKQFQQKA